MLEEAGVECPYCGEPFTTLVDCSSGDQAYVEDCRICCRPIELRIHLAEDGGLAALEVFRDDE
jgi:hypothetical protein